MKVVKTRIRVMAEFASLVLSTRTDMSIPTPINPNPTEKSIKSRSRVLKIGTCNRSSNKIHARLCNKEKSIWG